MKKIIGWTIEAVGSTVILVFVFQTKKFMKTLFRSPGRGGIANLLRSM